MNIIGKFNRAPDGSFLGEIITLSVQAQNVRLVPVAPKSANDPTYRILVGTAHIGNGWPTDGSTLHLALDDPSFAAAIEADLCEQADGTFSLVWLRKSSQIG